MDGAPPDDLLRQFDLVEARAWSSYYTAASPEVGADLGVGLEWVDGAVVTALADIDSRWCSRPAS